MTEVTWFGVDVVGYWLRRQTLFTESQRDTVLARYAEADTAAPRGRRSGGLVAGPQARVQGQRFRWGLWQK